MCLTAVDVCAVDVTAGAALALSRWLPRGVGLGFGCRAKTGPNLNRAPLIAPAPPGAAPQDPARQQALSQQWLQTEANAKQQIKMAVLNTLGSDVKAARHTAAQAVSAMATIDLPHNQWPDLIQGLVSNVRNSAPVCVFLSLAAN